jgi:hypothetical protein
MNPTDEQLNIIRQINKSHVVVDAVAGSGKTSTVKYIAMTYMRENIVALMYNVERRKDTVDAMKKYGFKHVHVWTFNSAGYNLYGDDCFNDSGIGKIIDEDRSPCETFYYNIFIIDEVQDMTDLYYRFIQKMMKDTKSKDVKIVLLGDYKQAINTFNGSTIDYIIEPEKYYTGEWSHLPLSETFRLTIPMVNFINAINGGRVLRSSKKSDKKPQYYICNDEFAMNKVKDYLKIYKPQDIFIITPTTRKSNNISNLSNMLTAEGIPLYVTGDMQSKKESMNGKLVISTVHSAKGSERKVVFVYGFDSSVLPKMLKKDDSLLYVALTRASEELIIFHNISNAFIISPDIVREYCDFYATGEYKNFVDRKIRSSNSAISVTDMVKFLSFDKIKACMSCINVDTIQTAGENIAELYAIPSTIPSTVKGSVEDVADINGFMIPCYHAGFIFNYESLSVYFAKLYKKDSKYISLIKKSISAVIAAKNNIDSPEHILRAATAYCGLCNNLFYKSEQISSYNWMSLDFLKRCSSVMSSVLDDFVEYEVPAQNGRICGRIDARCHLSDTIFEFKCVNHLTEEHIIQLALYAYLFKASSYKLLNIYTSELLEISFVDGKSPTDIVQILNQ